MEKSGTEKIEESVEQPELKAVVIKKAPNESTLDSKTNPEAKKEKESNKKEPKNNDNDESKAKEKSNEAKSKDKKDTKDDILNKMSMLNLSQEKEVKKLEEFNIGSVAKFMKTCKNIIFMVGAGISTSAGIPDFRSPGTGLYSKLDKYNLPCPEAIFSIQYFKLNPEPYFILQKELFPENFKPTPTHKFLRLVHEKGQLLRCYTQNIDMLEQLAGLPESKIIAAHGNFKKAHCIDCHKEFSYEWVKNEVKEKVILSCEDCNGYIKPDIVFFGEALPPQFFNQLTIDVPKCDLLIIMGTSLKVSPFNHLPFMVPEDCPRLLINRDPVGQTILEYEENDNKRDVFYASDCDSACELLAELLGWQNDYKQILNAN